MQVLALLKYIAESGKLVAFDIAELSPVHDKDDKTASLAASLFAQVLSYNYKTKSNKDGHAAVFINYFHYANFFTIK